MRQMRTRVLVALAMGLVTTTSGKAAAQAQLSFYEPGIAPDGGTIAFVHGGDIWTVPSQGGEARILIAHEEEESRPIYSPDGSQLAFESYRDGTSHIYLYDFASGGVTPADLDIHVDHTRRLVRRFGVGLLQLHLARHLGHDRRLSGSCEWGGRRCRCSRIAMPATSGHRRPRMGAWRSLLAEKNAFSQWWRHGHSHMDESEIWIADPNSGSPAYTPVSTGGKNQWPMWMADGRIAFVSDRDGAENLWVTQVSGDATKVTSLRDGRVLWPTYSPADGGRIAFERDFQIWTHDVASGRTAAINIRPIGAVQGPPDRAEQHQQLSGILGLTRWRKAGGRCARGALRRSRH